VHLDRGGVPDGGETLDQIAGRDDLRTRLADELDGAGVNPGDVGNRAPGGVFHRHAADAGEQRPQAGLELIAAGILRRRSGQMSQRIFFDLVDEAPRITGGGNEVIPAARRKVAALFSHPGHVSRNRIQAAKIVQQPPVEAVGRQRGLDRGNVEPGRYLRRRHPLQV